MRKKIETCGESSMYVCLPAGYNRADDLLYFSFRLFRLAARRLGPRLAPSAKGRQGQSIPNSQHIAKQSPGQPDAVRADRSVPWVPCMLVFNRTVFQYHSHVILQGRLDCLGTIPDKYYIAVSAAYGAFNNMVVNTVAQAQACIELLRKQNI
jgi:hypothetical protein